MVVGNRAELLAVGVPMLTITETTNAIRYANLYPSMDYEILTVPLDGKCLAANDLDHPTEDEAIRYWIAKCRRQLNDIRLRSIVKTAVMMRDTW